MRQTQSLRAYSPSKQIAFTALFAALCCIGTAVIAIPLPVGYFNVGDVFTLLAGWCLGPWFGGLAAGLGGAIADIVGGYSLYAPATFIIKALDAFVAYLLWAFLKRSIQKSRLDPIARTVAAFAGESLMILGYFLYDEILYGFAAAVGGLLGNALQGLLCMTLAVLICTVLYRAKPVKSFFPHLDK